VHTRCVCVGGVGFVRASLDLKCGMVSLHIYYTCVAVVRNFASSFSCVILCGNRAPCAAGGKVCVYSQYVCAICVFVSARAPCAAREGTCTHLLYVYLYVQYVCVCAHARLVVRPVLRGRVSASLQCVCVCVCVCAICASDVCARVPSATGEGMRTHLLYACVHTCCMHVAFIGRFVFSLSHVCSSMYRAPCAAARKITCLHSQYVCVCVRAPSAAPIVARKCMCILVMCVCVYAICAFVSVHAHLVLQGRVG